MKLVSKNIILASLPLVMLAGVPSISYAQTGVSQSSETLQNALRRLARNSNDSSALADAGLAALDMGDTRAAIGFLAKADQIYPRSGRVKAGLAKALLLEQNPFGALRYFDEAVANGVRLNQIAGDRGLAYDLIGRNREAQKDYEVALRSGPSDELLNRYAISLGISGDIEAADAKLNPLLQKSDRDAWRHRAFIMAMNGKGKDANQIARQTMQRKMARAIKPFFDRMPKLTAAQKAAAVHYGHFPASENIGVDVASVQYAANSAIRGGDGADAGLIPLGKPLGEEVKKPKILAMPNTSPRRRPGNRNIPGRAASKKPLEIVVLDRDTMPAPVGRRALSQSARDGQKTRRIAADSAEGRRLLRKAAREGSAEARAYLGQQKQEKTDLASAEKTETNTPPPIALPREAALSDVKEPIPAPLSQTAAVNTDKPQPKSATTPRPASVAAKSATRDVAAPGFETLLEDNGRTSKTPFEIARAEVPKTDLVSNSLQRKVAIGNVPAPTSLISNTIVGDGKTDANKPDLAETKPLEAKPAGEKPVQMASFDLATSVPARSKSIQTAAVAATRKPLADIIGSISIPDAEKKTTVVPVDLETITPATRKPKTEVEKKKPEPKKAEPDHPKRYWFQIATGSNISALKYDYRRMAKKHGDLFKGHGGWTSPFGRTRRLVVGPFDSLGDAKKFETRFRKGGGDGFAWVSKQGTEVNKLP